MIHSTKGVRSYDFWLDAKELQDSPHHPVDDSLLSVPQFFLDMTSMTLLTIHRRSSKGFTLVEMLVVAALISIFAGLAVINIQSVFEQNKQKAAVAEARQLATAMAFAQQDMGFFPKLCFLRFNADDLRARLISGGNFVNGVENNSFFVGNLEDRLIRSWKGIYSSLNQTKLVRMTFQSAFESPTNPGFPAGVTSVTFDWPADPWNNPYVVYLVKTNPGNPPVPSFLENSGDRANAFAGVISYGRNGVPGLGDVPDPTDRNARVPLRLFDQIDNFNFRLFRPDELTQAQLDMILISDTPDPLRPRIREQGSDDRFAEF
jgi:prepilin-type N-terminal cleavage/methylation domain-containing protein